MGCDFSVDNRSQRYNLSEDSWIVRRKGSVLPSRLQRGQLGIVSPIQRGQAAHAARCRPERQVQRGRLAEFDTPACVPATTTNDQPSTLTLTEWRSGCRLCGAKGAARRDGIGMQGERMRELRQELRAEADDFTLVSLFLGDPPPEINLGELQATIAAGLA